MPQFKKGDKVHYIGTWNRKGKFFIYSAVVYSCGKKRMILLDETGDKFRGRNFKPQEVQTTFNIAETLPTSVVLKGLTDKQAEEKAQELARAYKEREIRFLTERYTIDFPNASGGYVNAMKKSVAACEADEVGVVWPNRR